MADANTAEKDWKPDGGISSRREGTDLRLLVGRGDASRHGAEAGAVVVS